MFRATLSSTAFLEYEGEMDVGQTEEEGPVMVLSAELNQVLVQEGLCASLGSLMTVTGQLSNRKGSNQICNSVEDGSDPERLEKGRPTRRSYNNPGNSLWKD